MPKLYPITLYYNTLYNTGNIPDSPARLADFDSKQFPSVHLRQDYGIAEVKINATWSEVMDADYAMLEAEEGNTYWVIPEPPRMDTDHTASIKLVMDPLTTLGGIGKISVVSGWARRAHVTDDSPFYNVLPEPWAPSQPLEIRDYKVINIGSNEPDKNIAIATCDLSRGTQYKADIWHASRSVDGEEVTGDVITPRPPTPGIGGTQPIPTDNLETTLSIDAYRGPGTPAEHYSYTMPNMYAFDLSDPDVIAGINAIRAIGIESTILAMYTLPGGSVSVTPSADIIYPGGDEKTSGLISEINGEGHLLGSGMPYKYKTTKNAKAYALHNQYVITSITSGDTNSFGAADLYSGGEAPDWVVTSDPSPSGTSYCGPSYYEGKPTHRLEQTVAGLPWLNAGFSYSSSSGSMLSAANAQRRNSQIDANRDISVDINTGQQALNITNGILSAVNDAAGIAANVSGRSMLPSGLSGARLSQDKGLVGSITGLIGDAANTALHEGILLDERKRINYNANYEMGDNLFSASVAANVVAPQMAFPISVNAAAYFGQGFAVSHITLRDNDLERFDDFLSAYGYARDTKFVLSMLSNRKNHNYIKTSGCMVSSDGAPRWLLDSVARMFDSGVQIWHVKPSQSALVDNPVRS